MAGGEKLVGGSSVHTHGRVAHLSSLPPSLPSLQLAGSTPLEDFKDRWQTITNYLVSNPDEKIPVERTDIPDHLEEMVRILVAEEQEQAEDMGPCMEFLLQHNILKTAVEFAQGDFPRGMLREV